MAALAAHTKTDSCVPTALSSGHHDYFQKENYVDDFNKCISDLYKMGSYDAALYVLYGRTGGDTCGNSKDRRHAADTADGHHEKDAADLTDGRLGGRVTRKEIYETELPHRAVAVYLYLETRADRERTCYPAIGTIARELHLSVSTVKRAIRDLECAGFIQKKQRWRENGGKSSLLYEIIK